MKIKVLHLTILLLLSTIVLNSFQNCSGMTQFDLDAATDMSLSSTYATDHPGPMKPEPPKQKILVANRVFVAALMRDIFKRSNEDDWLEGQINKWILYRPAQFGGACNTYSSQSQKDCNGDVANVNMAANVDDNTIRESYRLQFCRTTLGFDEFVDSALSRVSIARNHTPDADKILQVYSLFYQDTEAEPLVVESLVALDESLKAANEPLLERWRALLLTLCESPNWQLL